LFIVSYYLPHNFNLIGCFSFTIKICSTQFYYDSDDLPSQEIINTELFIDRAEAPYIPIREADQSTASSDSWLEGQVYLALKRCGKERSSNSLSQNEFGGNVQEVKHFC